MKHPPEDQPVALPTLQLFRPPVINAVGNYRFCQCTRSYIRILDERCSLAPQQKAAGSGFADVEDWEKHRQEWWDFQEDIPISYLRTIGVTNDTLLKILELDKDAFEAAKTLPLFPTHFLIRWMASIYQNAKLPDNCTEEQGIEIVRTFVSEKRFRACINFGDLKTLFFEPDHPKGCTINTTWYVPGLVFSKTHLIPNRDGTRNGSVTIGGIKIHPVRNRKHL